MKLFNILPLLALALLTACGNGNKAPEASAGENNESAETTEHPDLLKKIKADDLFIWPAAVYATRELPDCEEDLEGVVPSFDGNGTSTYYYKAYTPRISEILSWEEYTVRKDFKRDRKGDKWLFCHLLVEQGEKSEAYKKLLAEDYPLDRDYLADGPVQVLACFQQDRETDEWNYKGIVALESLLIQRWRDGKPFKKSYDGPIGVCPIEYAEQMHNY